MPLYTRYIFVVAEVVTIGLKNPMLEPLQRNYIQKWIKNLYENDQKWPKNVYTVTFDLYMKMPFLKNLYKIRGFRRGL